MEGRLVVGRWRSGGGGGGGGWGGEEEMRRWKWSDGGPWPAFPPSTSSLPRSSLHVQSQRGSIARRARTTIDRPASFRVVAGGRMAGGGLGLVLPLRPLLLPWLAVYRYRRNLALAGLSCPAATWWCCCASDSASPSCPPPWHQDTRPGSAMVWLAF